MKILLMMRKSVMHATYLGVRHAMTSKENSLRYFQVLALVSLFVHLTTPLQGMRAILPTTDDSQDQL